MTGHHPAAQTPNPRCAPPSVHGLLKDEIAGFCTSHEQPAYRASQIWQWLYVQRVGDWAAMRNVPASLRDELASAFSITPLRVTATDGTPDEVRKLLLELNDGEQVEEVLIPARGRNTVCVSSQAGCRFHCAFCASGQNGYRRNLQAGEMVAQVLTAAALGDKPTHVVFMGVGEPLDNYDNVLRAVRILNDKDGLSIGARRITISTCGIVPGIRQLAGEGLQVELSVSLHAPTDDLRSTLMPVNRKYPIAELLAACSDYSRTTNRIITFEYTLIRGVNDSRGHARALANILAPLPARVNLIPLSPVTEYDRSPTDEAAARSFAEILGQTGINATLRASRGCSLSAACGQLRAAAAANNSPGN